MCVYGDCYFATVEAINDQGRPIELADLRIECG
jgi:hypothetical protein